MDLYPYQQEGVDFLFRRKRAYLADGMGLGKSAQAARAAELIGAEETLVVCPASARENWRREWVLWNRNKGARLTVASYASSVLPTGSCDLVILDEAHYAKNPKAKRTLRALDVARKAKRAWLLSGTPMPNDPSELWAPLRALWPVIPQKLGIKSYHHWFNHFCSWTQTRYGKRVYGIKNAHELQPHLNQMMLRRVLEDVALDLPPLRVDVSLLPKDPAFAAALKSCGVDPERLEKRIQAEDHEEGSSSRLRRLLGEYKAPRIGDILAQELKDQEYSKIVVLAYHKSVLATLREKLAAYGVVGFDGSTPGPKRQEAIDAFRDGPARVFLAQQSAAGVAINLQAASEIVLVEPAWSPDDNAQAIKRVHRIGSEKPVRARVFGVAGSLDESIMRTVATKTKMQAELGL